MLNDDVQTRLVTVTEAATIMRCSVETVRRRLRLGTLTGRRDVNGTGREVWSVAVPATGSRSGRSRPPGTIPAIVTGRLAIT